MINISVERYLKLLNDERTLKHLHAGGVDNWEWYSESLPDEEILREHIKPGIIVEDERKVVE